MNRQSVLILLSLLVLESFAQVPGLLDALRKSGASKFAASIESDATIANLAQPSQVQTVFAVSDDAGGSNVKRQLSPAEEQQSSLQFSGGLNHLNALNKRPGAVVPTKNNVANLGGKPQNIVTDTRNTTGNGVTKRGAPLIQRQSLNTTVLGSLRIFSGLGNSVSVTTGDIAYDGGVIHIVDGYFTLPRTLSATTLALGHNTFTALTNSSDLTAELDSAAGITIFIPTNAAFAAKNVSSSDPTTPSLIDGHIVPNFVGYVPALTDGAKLLTQAGTTVTVTVQGDDIFINNAKILASNVILENGVAHVLDQIISFAPDATPSPTPTIVPFKGTGLSARPVDTFQVFLVFFSFAFCVVLFY
ncbi:hypothetical protein MMC30_005605 [Trapelia coarctata]|nr:hypothetical protein [Trapelia coarctata]